MTQQRLPRVARVLGRDHNPLRRYVDKLESAIMTGLVVAFLVAAPLLAIFAGRQADATGLRAERAEHSWQQVPAVLQESAGAGQIGLDGESDTSWVTAHWTVPGAGQRSGLIAVGLGAKAGSVVLVWVTSSGQLTHQPVDRAEVEDQIAVAATIATATLAALLLAVAATARVMVNRRRMLGWTRAWEGTGPQGLPHR
jgi:hypothetical protein